MFCLWHVVVLVSNSFYLAVWRTAAFYMTLKCSEGFKYPEVRCSERCRIEVTISVFCFFRKKNVFEATRMFEKIKISFGYGSSKKSLLNI